MFEKIVECCPNFSEGQRKEVIEAIAGAISNAENCTLLDVDPGQSTNRTVYTFIGSPDGVQEAALNAARTAYQLIDMSRHRGEHPRMGSMDVCPFIPVRGVSMEECIEIARDFAVKLAEDLAIPVYLYGAAANSEQRRMLPDVRSGEYEKLSEKLADPDWVPDYGPAAFVPRWGATAVGARKFLIAYNINILSTKEQAHRIALDLREQGRGLGKPGLLKGVQGLGWYLDEANLAQVSFNILDCDVTPLHVVFNEAKRAAEELNLALCGSQIVGLVPLECILESADYYIQNENLFVLEEDQKIKLVVDRLGLSSINPFIAREKIVEYMVPSDSDGLLQSMEVKDFIMTVATRTPSPGGGSVAAITGALGVALASMAGFLTFGNRKFAHLDSEMRLLLPQLYSTVKELIPSIDSDASAFASYMAALKLPSSQPKEEAFKKEALTDATLRTINVPLNVARMINKLWLPLKKLSNIVNINCKSDLQVGIRSLETASWGAFYNVTTNLTSLEDMDLRNSVSTEMNSLLKEAKEYSSEILDVLENRKADVTPVN